MTTSIERIREQVQRVREEHKPLDAGLCSATNCYFFHPNCPTLRLAEDKLKLGEWIEKERERHAPSGPDQRCLACGLSGNCCGTFHAAERILAEVAE